MIVLKGQGFHRHDGCRALEEAAIAEGEILGKPYGRQTLLRRAVVLGVLTSSTRYAPDLSASWPPPCCPRLCCVGLGKAGDCRPRAGRGKLGIQMIEVPSFIRLILTGLLCRLNLSASLRLDGHLSQSRKQVYETCPCFAIALFLKVVEPLTDTRHDV